VNRNSALQALVDRARAGDEQAWRELVDRYQKMLTSVARMHRLRPADAEDVVQATWVRAVEHLDELREPACLPAWLITTCRRESLRVSRQLSRERPEDITDTTSSIAAFRDPAGDAFDQVALKDEALRLYSALQDLPERERRVVVGLIRFAEEGYSGCAKRLGLPVGSLGPTRQRALTRLRRDPRLRRA